jgi:S1-C subfamily serine protease
MSIYRISSQDAQAVYDGLKSLANECRDEDGPLQFADKYLSQCDLSSPAKKNVEIDVLNVSDGNILTVRSGKYLNAIYSRLRELDEKDGKLDGNISAAADVNVDLNGDDMARHIESWKRSVVATMLTMADGSNYGGSAFVVEKVDVSRGEKKNYRYTAYTAAHVVDNVFGEELKLEVNLNTQASPTPIKAKIVGVDHYKDFAVIEFESTENMPVLPLGNSDSVTENDKTLTIGNRSLEDVVALPGTVVNPSVGIGGWYIGHAFKVNDSGTSGNSGGAVLNESGDVIGITIRAETNDIGGNLSIVTPIDAAKRSAEKIRKFGKAQYSDIGYYSKILLPDVAERLGLQAGVILSQVIPGGTASRAGLKSGDIVVNIGGSSIAKKINRWSELYKLDEFFMNKEPGETVAMTVFRSGAMLNLDVRLGATSFESPRAWHTPYQFTAVELTPALRSQLGQTMQDIKGVIVELDDEKINYTKYGLAKRSVITHVGNVAVDSVEKFKSEVEKQSKAGGIVLRCVATDQSPQQTNSVSYINIPTS